MSILKSDFFKQVHIPKDDEIAQKSDIVKNHQEKESAWTNVHWDREAPMLK